MVFNYYKIVNKQSGKIYIGITSKSFQTRWKQHINLLNKQKHPNRHLQKDWNICGINGFNFLEIESKVFDDLEDGYQYEYDLIQLETSDKYNIAPGGQINPMYSEQCKEKMKRTKQQQVPDIYQLKEEEENVFRVINIFQSQKEAGRETNADQGNIQHAITKHTKGCGFYWITKTTPEEFGLSWRPSRTKFKPCAQLDENNHILKVHHNRSLFEKEYNWTSGCIKGAIQRDGKTHGIKFINISEEQYYKLKPVRLIF